ncbi:Hypothetical predicted protein [Mytilus galloprovincialis]|uniref:C1q domain-containing protein n=1 Tax=Mytilus galloprovincialis TaxID=29158 RepID=A0A8B6G5V8_MYTGA|nr:Hypothetical predicted protein [Mytilus galloprovincialis]
MFKKIKETGTGLSQHDKVFSAFAASLTASKTLGHGEIVKFDKVWTNVNNDYDPITGVYTSPEPGVYQFSCSVMTQNDKKNFECTCGKIRKGQWLFMLVILVIIREL